MMSYILMLPRDIKALPAVLTFEMNLPDFSFNETLTWNYYNPHSAMFLLLGELKCCKYHEYSSHSHVGRRYLEIYNVTFQTMYKVLLEICAHAVVQPCIIHLFQSKFLGHHVNHII